ncbi:HYR domain-containing protein [Aquimarina sp. 433]
MKKNYKTTRKNYYTLLIFLLISVWNYGQNADPIAACQDVTVQLDETGNVVVDAASLDNGSSDPDGDPITFSLVGSQTVFAQVNERQDLTITLPEGAVVDAVEFASYGIPTGSNGDFAIGNCHAADSQAIVEGFALGNNTFTIPATNAIFGDPCSGVVKRLAVVVSYIGNVEQITLDCNAIGINDITFTANDDQGNSATCTAVVTVEDTIVPIITCQDITVALGPDGTVIADVLNDGSILNLNDNCDQTPSVVITGPDVYTCDDLGTFSRDIIVTDASGNEGSCTAQVTVVDQLSPTTVCNDIIVQLDENGQTSISAADIDAGSTDNCTIDTMSLNQDTFGTADLGENEVTLTVTDQSGNSSSCTAIVTVIANDFPVVRCQDITVQLNEGGTVSITATQMDAGSTDTEGIAAFSVTPSSFDCSNIGANEVTLTVTNTRGNSSTCRAMVTVEDITAPIIACPENITLDCPDIVTYEVAVSDCNFAEVPSILDGFTLLGTLGTSTYFISDQEMTASEAFQKAQEERLDILTINTIEENEFIQTFLTDNTIDGVLIGLNDQVEEDTFIWQSGQPATFRNFNSGEPNNVGNEDFVRMIASSGLWNDITGVISTRLIVEFHDYTTGPILISGEESGNFFLAESTTNTFFAKDNSGNIASCSFDVTIADDTAPTITCAPDISVATDPNSNEASITIATPAFGDNCGDQVIPDTFNVFYRFNDSGDLIDTPTILSGLSTTNADVTLEITFNGDHNDVDNEKFVLTGPDDQILLEENNSGCSIVKQFVVVEQETWNTWINTFGDAITFTLLENNFVDDNQCGSIDNNFFRLRLPQFGNVSIVNDYTNTSDASGVYPVGTTVVNWTIEDNQGNSTSCEQRITVNDTEAPVVTCVDDIVIDLDETSCSMVVNFDFPSASDNFAVFDNTLDDILLLFNRKNSLVSSLIPNPFDFQLDEGLNASSIDDGGDDMYDDGNFISTDLSTGTITYSDNVVVPLADFGTNGAYFTRKVENLWLLAADLDGVTDFDITGELGADGDGLADGFTATITVNTINYNIFVKRVREELDGSSSDPSVNHLIIIPENVEASQNFADDTDDDQHQVTGLINTNRLYYLLFASIDSGLVDDTTVQLIATSFIDNITTATGTITQTAGLASGSEFPAGETVNTFEVVDEFGNTTSCSFTVNVNETTAPTAVCQDITVQLDEDGRVSITAADIDGGSSDNCGIAEMSIDVTTFDCGSIGDNTVTLTVVDNNDNTDSCTAIVTVENPSEPQISCPADQTVGSDEGNDTYQLPDYFAIGEAIAIGTCANPLVTFTQNPAPGTLLSSGTTTVTLCAADESGTEICCSFELTVDPTLSTDEFELFAGVSVYPNPVIDILHITNSNKATLNKIEIYDINGRLVLTSSKSKSNDDIEINVSNFESGSYFVRIQGVEGSVIKQLIKK